MITKGIVEEIITPYQIKVRLPIYDKMENSQDATPNENLSKATICTLLNTKNQVNKNDIVFVAFEDNDISKPIIIGQLYRESLSSIPDLNVRAFTTNAVTTLDANTTIGTVSPNEIKCLEGARYNLQAQIDRLREDMEKLRRDMNA